MSDAEKLKAIIKYSDYTQEKLAQLLEVSFSSVNNWLHEKTKPQRRQSHAINELYVFCIGLTSDSDVVLDELRASCMKLSFDVADCNTDTFNRIATAITYHTNALEGSTMTYNDVKDVTLYKKVLTNRTQAEQLEAINHRNALQYIFDTAKQGVYTIDEPFILDIHRRLMVNLISDAGEYRTSNVRIMGRNVPLANHVSVPVKITQWVEQYGKVTKSDTTPDVLAASHAAFEQIHPFSDGNGRTGRLLLIAQALQSKTAPPIIQRERKEAYNNYLEVAQVREEYARLTMFMCQAMEYGNRIARGDV